MSEGHTPGEEPQERNRSEMMGRGAHGRDEERGPSLVVFRENIEVQLETTECRFIPVMSESHEVITAHGQQVMSALRRLNFPMACVN